jgi:ABC-type antimicrobial peptide transport system permease subunit
LWRARNGWLRRLCLWEHISEPEENDKTLDKVSVDFRAHCGYCQGNESSVIASLETVNNVEYVGFTSLVGHFEIDSPYGYRDFQSIWAVPEEFHDTARRLGMTGNFSLLGPNDLVVSSYTADILDLEIGDEVTFVNEYWDPIVFNFTEATHNMTVSGITHFESEDYYGIPEYYFSSYVRLDQIQNILESLNQTYWDGSVNFYIWIDRNEILDPYDIETTKARLERTRVELSYAASDHSLEVEHSQLVAELEGFDWNLLFQRFFFLAFSLPVIGLGIYLGYIGMDLGMAERRRELGILKSRGMNRWQVMALLTTESILLGAIAGILGLIFGILASRFFISFTAFGLPAKEGLLSFNINIWTVVISIAFAILFILIAGYRPTKRISKVEPVESLRRFSPEEAEVKYKPTWDIIFLGLGIFEYSVVLFLRGPSDGGLYVFLCALSVIVIVLLPFSPFFLIFGLTRLLTRATTRIYSAAARVSKFFTKDLHYIVEKNLARNPRRASSVCLVIALGVAFGIFVSSMGETQLAYGHREKTALIGGDIAIHTYGMNDSFDVALVGVEGVEAVCTGYWIYGGWPFLVLDSANYTDVVDLDPYFFAEGEPKDAMLELRQPGTVIISSDLAKGLYLGRGDNLITTIGEETKSLRVVGVVKVLPGLVSEMDYLYPQSPSSFYVDVRSFNSTELMDIKQDAYFRVHLIDVQKGYDSSVVADRIEDELSSFGALNPIVLKEEIDEMLDDPFQGSIYNLMMIEVAFAILILTLGIGIVMYVATLERKDEFASIMARGASNRQLSNLMLGEGVSIMVIGLSIGIAVGMLTSFIFNEFISYTLEVSNSLLDRPLIFGFQTMTVIAVSIVSLILATVIATIGVRRMKLAQALRRRGG